MILVAIGVLLNRAHYRQMMGEFLENSALMYFSGALSFLIGMALVIFHNLWVTDWRVVITLIGWMSLIKGVGRIVFPRAAPAMGAKILAKQSTLDIMTAVMLAVGFYLTVMAAPM